MAKSSKILGSSAIKTSVANEEILPAQPVGWTFAPKFMKFSLMNYADCTLIIDGEEIFLKANQGIALDYDDASINSVKIKEDGIEFNWIGAY